MRVAIVTESFLPTLNGVTTSVLRVSEYLVARGQEVMVIAPQVSGASDTPAGVKVHRVPSFAYRDFPVGLPHPMVSSLLERFRPDVLHAASPFLLGYQALLAARKLSIPSVAIFQTDVAGYAKRNSFGAAENFAWWVVSQIHGAADLTLVPSKTSLQQLRQCGVTNLASWGRGVDLSGFHPGHRFDEPTVRFRRRIAKATDTIVGYVGRLAPEKSVERLQVLRGVKGIHVVVVGDGPSESSVKKALSGIPHSMTGALRGEALHRVYGSFDLFVHTGEEETFGQTLQEAHASGLPVIAPAVGGPLDLIDDGVDGVLYPSGHDQELRDAVMTLRDNQPLRVRMGEAGRQKVLGRDWTAVCEDLVSHYHRVMRGAPVRALPREGNSNKNRVAKVA